ncbi:MAG: PAS domain S-box protein [Bdellovibrionales bacterium]
MIDYSVFDSLFDSTVVVDQDRKILYCNEAAAMLAGSSVRRLTKGVIFSDIYQLQDRELYPVSGGELGRDSAAPMRELNFSIKSTGRQGKLQVTVQPFSEAESKRWVVIMHDVTLEETLHTKYQGELEQKEGYIRELQHAKAKLEDYSKNLEHMVEERTAEVRTANRMLNAIMNSLGQGFLVFDQKGICSTIFTKACEEILEGVPAHRPIWDVLQLQGGQLAQFKMWMQAVFAESLPFESMVELAPSLYQHSLGKHITLSYYPIRSDEGQITNLVMVATDRTREYEAEQALLKEQQYIQMVLKVIKNREQFGLFLSSTRALIQQLKVELKSKAANFDFGEAFRTLHTLEGEAGLFSAALLRQVSRDCQEVLEPFRQGEKYDRHLMLKNLAAEVQKLEVAFDEFLKTNHELLEVLKVGETRNVEVSVEKLVQFADLMRKQDSPLLLRQRFSDDLLRQPLSLFLRHFNEVAQHVAQTQGKLLAPVEFHCDAVRVNPGHFDNLFASLVHAFRNAVDHGIETVEVRKERGKPESGKIKVSAREFDNKGRRWVRLNIEDDGGGIDPAIIRAKLCEKFPDQKFEHMSEHDVLQGLFMPGFSSREAVGQFSCLGIGMYAIKTE